MHPEQPAWHPEAYARRRPRLLMRSAITTAIRRFFLERDFLEVETPILQIAPGMEPHLQAFATALRAPDGSASRLYLHTSPEFACKKLLTAGEERLFTLARVFRNGERAAWHHPEFTLLEGYRARASYERLMEDCAELLAACAEAAGCWRIERGGKVCDLSRAPARGLVAEAYERSGGSDLL